MSSEPMPRQRTASDVIADARTTGKVIECTAPDGTTTAFLPIDMVSPGWFVGVTDSPFTGRTRGRIVDETNIDVIRNAVRTCEPDVTLVEEDDSLFAEVDR